MRALSYNDWKLGGRHVIKGEEATGRNKLGEATFTYDQTEPDEYDYGQDFYCGD